MSKQFTEKDAIRYLQTYLRAQRFIDPNAPSVPVDGIFDTQTRNALIDFQLKNGLPPTGVANRETWDLLYAQYLDILTDNTLPGPVIPFPSYPNDYSVKNGDRSFLVAIIQYIINEISVVYNTLAPLDIDGIYGNQTEEAIREIQEMSGLTPTGQTDRKTWDAISRIFNLSTHYIDQN